jgi:hypothetical protein
VAGFASEAEAERIISGMRWMGIFAAEKATIVGRNLLDTLCTQLEELMSFKEGERDLVMLQHKFVVEWANGDTVCLYFLYYTFYWYFDAVILSQWRVGC